MGPVSDACYRRLYVCDATGWWGGGGTHTDLHSSIVSAVIFTLNHVALIGLAPFIPEAGTL